MDENNLQINITAVDQASGTLQEVAATAEGMATSINQAAASLEGTMTGALTATEEAAVEAAITSANAWMGAEQRMAGTAVATAETMTGEFDAIAMSSRAAAISTVPTWQASLAEIAALGTMTQAELDAAFTKTSEGSKKSAENAKSTMTSMHGYFRMLIAGYLADTAGKALLGGATDAVTAAIGDPKKLQQLQTQLATAQAELQKESLPVSGRGRTTAELAADQAEQAARIAATKIQIQELKEQIEPLAYAQEHAGQAALDFAAAATQLETTWQHFLSSSGRPLLELLTHGIQLLDNFIVHLTAFAEAHPKVVEAVLITTGVLGVLLTAFGAFLIAISPLIIMFGMFGAAVTAASIAAAVGWAALATGALFVASLIITNWDNVKRYTQQTWAAVSGFVVDHWQAIIMVLLPGVGLLVSVLYDHWNMIKIDVETAWNWIGKFVTGIWDGIVSASTTALGKIQEMLNSLMAPINAVTGAVNKVGNLVGSGVNALSSVIPHFADGGIVSSPTIGLIGEAGPEAIIPLSAFAGGSSLAGAGAGGGAGNIVVQLSGNFYGSDQAMMNKLSVMLGKMINQQLKLRTH